MTFSELADMCWGYRLFTQPQSKAYSIGVTSDFACLIFVNPLKGDQFDGWKMSVQSSVAENSVEGKPLHSYTFFGSMGDAWVWMNLATFGGREVKVVPVHLKDQLPDILTREFLIKRSG